MVGQNKTFQTTIRMYYIVKFVAVAILPTVLTLCKAILPINIVAILQSIFVC